MLKFQVPNEWPKSGLQPNENILSTMFSEESVGDVQPKELMSRLKMLRQGRTIDDM